MCGGKISKIRKIIDRPEEPCHNWGMGRLKKWTNEEMWGQAVKWKRSGLYYRDITSRLAQDKYKRQFDLLDSPGEDTVRREVKRRVGEGPEKEEAAVGSHQEPPVSLPLLSLHGLIEGKWEEALQKCDRDTLLRDTLDAEDRWWDGQAQSNQIAQFAGAKAFPDPALDQALPEYFSSFQNCWDSIVNCLAGPIVDPALREYLSRLNIGWESFFAWSLAIWDIAKPEASKGTTAGDEQRELLVIRLKGLYRDRVMKIVEAAVVAMWLCFGLRRELARPERRHRIWLVEWKDLSSIRNKYQGLLRLFFEKFLKLDEGTVLLLMKQVMGMGESLFGPPPAGANLGHGPVVGGPIRPIPPPRVQAARDSVRALAEHYQNYCEAWWKHTGQFKVK